MHTVSVCMGDEFNYNLSVIFGQFCFSIYQHVSSISEVSQNVNC